MLYFKTLMLGDAHEWAVMVHGVGGSSTIWFKQLREYKKHFNVLLVDLRGHGRSQALFEDWLKKDYTFETVSRDVLEVLDHLGIEKAHFVGISIGTIVIRTIGEIAPGRVLSMVMGGAVVRLNIRSKFLMWTAVQIKKLVPFLWIYSIYAFILMPRKRNRESRVLFIREAKKLARKEILKWFNLTAEVNPILKYFSEKEIPVPTLYIMGEEDYMFLPQVKHIIRHHKYAVLTVLEACGHVVNVEKPDQFNHVSISFMQDPLAYQALPA